MPLSGCSSLESEEGSLENLLGQSEAVPGSRHHEEPRKDLYLCYYASKNNLYRW